jgi:hypothetical protein
LGMDQVLDEILDTHDRCAELFRVFPFQTVMGNIIERSVSSTQPLNTYKATSNGLVVTPDWFGETALGSSCHPAKGQVI